MSINAVATLGTGRSGTVKNRLFNALGKKPKSMKELMEVAELETVQYGYLNKWIEEKLVVKTEEGLYMRATKTPKASAAKGKKFASKDEANAARNERRRKARAAAKNSGEVVVSNEMPAEYATA